MHERDRQTDRQTDKTPGHSKDPAYAERRAVKTKKSYWATSQ